MNKIDLRSDTVTRPTPPMLEAMINSRVGDDVFGEDPTINELQMTLAEMFGFESGLFCSSGTMCNQIAIKSHCRPGDEIICSDISHIYLYEGGGTASNSGVSLKMHPGDRGRINADIVRSLINPDDAYYPISTLVSLEDTMNKGGGACYDLEDIEKIREVCDENNLKLHLDGARLFNSLVHKKHDYKSYAVNFDSISICLSKGLGCPVGSVLLGSKEFIKRAHRVRKSFGGGMRQAGILAGAGLYALENHVDRLEEDHRKALKIADKLKGLNFVKNVLSPETNIVVFELIEGINSGQIVEDFEEKGILIVPFGPDKARIVTHLDFSDEQLISLLETLDSW